MRAVQTANDNAPEFRTPRALDLETNSVWALVVPKVLDALGVSRCSVRDPRSPPVVFIKLGLPDARFAGVPSAVLAVPFESGPPFEQPHTRKVEGAHFAERVVTLNHLPRRRPPANTARGDAVGRRRPLALSGRAVPRFGPLSPPLPLLAALSLFFSVAVAVAAADLVLHDGPRPLSIRGRHRSRRRSLGLSQ